MKMAQSLMSMSHSRRVDAIQEALLDREDEHEPSIIRICHGDRLCEPYQQKRYETCIWCHRVEINDPRSAIEIEADLEQFQRGH